MVNGKSLPFVTGPFCITHSALHCTNIFPADLVIFTKEIFNGKLHFLCNAICLNLWLTSFVLKRCVFHSSAYFQLEISNLIFHKKLLFFRKLVWNLRQLKLSKCPAICRYLKGEVGFLGSHLDSIWECLLLYILLYNIS